ncbi:MAG TPA: Hpt domain-containing protein, partial [Anaerolineae bacterium]|nr:Hpt domain-containing protein [Anaerolineae bacterium]
MKNSGTDDLSDLSMLDLFCTELETNARVLETGLKHIEGQYSPEMIESLIRAAHSIKGAARIVDLEILVPLAGALENILSNVNQGKMLITSNDIETLVQCNNIFIGIASLNASEIHNQLKKQENIINDSCEKLTEMLSSIHIDKKTEKPALDVHQEIIHPLRRANDRIFDEQPDYSILELFRIEVENHSRVLEKGLLEIENNQSPEKIEPLMRAAHSIKGAARIINLNLEVSLAHTIEDVFSKVQRGALTLSANDIDILLRSNDIFLHLTTLNTSEITGWLFTQSNKIKILTQTLIDILAGKSVEPSTETETYKVTEFPVKTFPLKKEDSFVRVLTDNLNCMIGFAGECLVQAKSSKPFSTSLLQIKNTFMILASMLENILQSPHTASFSKETHIKIDESLKRFNQLREFLNQHIENYERFSRRFEYIADKLYGQVVECRMRPFSDGVQGFPRMVRDLAK